MEGIGLPRKGSSVGGWPEGLCWLLASKEGGEGGGDEGEAWWSLPSGREARRRRGREGKWRSRGEMGRERKKRR